MRVWEALDEGLFYPYHIQQVQHLEAVDAAQPLEFCRWLSAHSRLAHYILITDEAEFTQDEVNCTRNFHLWDRGNSQ
jgi:hypothetical protein